LDRQDKATNRSFAKTPIKDTSSRIKKDNKSTHMNNKLLPKLNHETIYEVPLTRNVTLLFNI